MYIYIHACFRSCTWRQDATASLDSIHVNCSLRQTKLTREFTDVITDFNVTSVKCSSSLQS